MGLTSGQSDWIILSEPSHRPGRPSRVSRQLLSRSWEPSGRSWEPQADLENLRADLENLRADLENLRADLGNLQADLGNLQADLENLGPILGTSGRSWKVSSVLGRLAEGFWSSGMRPGSTGNRLN